MDYKEKIQRMDEHLKTHPKDYQTVIALVKANSDAIADKRRKQSIEIVKEVAEIRRARHEKSKQ